MNRINNVLIMIFIAAFLSISCSTIKPIQIHHQSERAFLEWWKTPHYEVAAFMPFGLWVEIDKSQKFEASSDVLKGTEKIFRVLIWDDNKWFLVLSQNHNKCNKQRAWIVQLPKNIWISLDHELSYELCIGDSKYSDVTESNINLYWCEDTIHPIIEITTNGPACTSYYLYVWHPEKNGYELYDKKCD